MNKTKAIVFFGIIIIGLVISLVSLNVCGKKVEVAGEPETPQAPEKKEETPKKTGEDGKSLTQPTEKPAEGTKEKSGPNSPDAKKPKPASVANTFETPKAAASALASEVQKRDFGGFSTVAGEKSMTEEMKSKIEQIVKDEALKLKEGDPVGELSKSVDSIRWSINLEPVSGQGEPTQIYSDIVKGEDGKYSVSKISLPISLSAITRGMKPGKSQEAKPANGTPQKVPETSEAVKKELENADALSIAHAFSKAVIARNFEVARALSDPSNVTDERLAALMYAVEEGNFELKEDRPLIVTLSREDITWVLSRVQSGDQVSEFALELGKAAEDWLVNGLTFSKVIASLANRSGAGGVAYAPLVEDPEGGDSLVLYFEFDDSGITSRANRQLAIVADILSRDKTRKIHINGHTDSLGTDDYNKGLSDNRATNVREALLLMGVSADQIVTEAFGESKPRFRNLNEDGTDNPGGRSRNRRAEVYLDF